MHTGGGSALNNILTKYNSHHNLAHDMIIGSELFPRNYLYSGGAHEVLSSTKYGLDISPYFQITSPGNIYTGRFSLRGYYPDTSVKFNYTTPTTTPATLGYQEPIL